VPADVSSIQVEAWGGSGGGYVTSGALPVTADESLNIYVGAGGASACSGSNGAGGDYSGSVGGSTAAARPPALRLRALSVMAARPSAAAVTVAQ
jgi:hypothetical protein